MNPNEMKKEEWIVQIQRWSDKEILTHTIPAKSREEAVKVAMDSFFALNPGDKAKLILSNPVVQ